MQEQSFDSETHFFKQKIVQENSALQEGEPTLPPGYLSPLVVHWQIENIIQFNNLFN